MGAEGKEARVTGVLAPGLTPCRVPTTVSAVEQQTGDMTNDRESALFTSSCRWSVNQAGRAQWRVEEAG